MKLPLYIDLETYCELPLSTSGAHRYAEEAEILVFAYAIGAGSVVVCDLTKGDKIPNELYDSEVPLVIHNSGFDRTIIRHVLKYDIDVKRVHDTMVQARTLGLPGALGQLCDILKIPADKAKDKRGKDLIQLFCKPRPANNNIRRATRETHPTEWREFLEYARLDIEAMRAIHNKLPLWNYRDRELALWHLDQKINDRGVRIDTELARAALRTIAHTKAQLDENTSKATLGLVDSAAQRDELLGFILGAYGVALPDMQSATLERRIEDPNLPVALRELLALRLQTCTTSTAKYKTMLNSISSDDRLRGILEFCGASRTGRWAGRKFQPQNLPSRNLPPQADIERGITLLKNGCADLVFDDMMWLTSSCLRGLVVAPDSKLIYAADLSNIEGRVAAWLAGEEWKLKAFRDYDTGSGPDLYIMAYAKAFNVLWDSIDKATSEGYLKRQIGKVMELMLQYEGGVGAFITGAATYGIDLDAMAGAAWDSIPQRIRKEAQGAWKWATQKETTYGLSEKTYMVCDALKRMWREAHPEISSYWKELENTAVTAITTPGKTFACRKLTMRRDGAWLRIILPSGRSLCYGAPMVEDGKISYMGMNQYSRKWTRLKTYGGKIFENICQAVARDIMAHNMPAIEDAGYDIILTVHDEVVTEAPADNRFSVEKLSALLAIPPPWGLDLPLAAGGFEAPRYRKGH